LIGFVFRAALTQQDLHNPLLLLILHQFIPRANWLCFFKSFSASSTVIPRPFDLAQGRLDAESRIIKKSGFLLEFIPHPDAGQE
jgi:hypothetical protein